MNPQDFYSFILLVSSYTSMFHANITVRVVATVGGAGRGRPPLTISARH